ncbi:phd zinc finger-containing protein [Stylonychia lemnae]|uniref:Phd zinc finger-containing protein n=1 Tax=Stylonychia lemnae TaxID=5949 RepID=A0A077ZQ89_STYLE|nr:phd zinc finger-containing protein [Stylonychia lemnae]|eukprot:CDW71624.1 phd zinc finger-containing protein [Stylonychia lemnae]
MADNQQNNIEVLSETKKEETSNQIEDQIKSSQSPRSMHSFLSNQQFQQQTNQKLSGTSLVSVGAGGYHQPNTLTLPNGIVPPSASFREAYAAQYAQAIYPPPNVVKNIAQFPGLQYPANQYAAQLYPPPHLAAVQNPLTKQTSEGLGSSVVDTPKAQTLPMDAPRQYATPQNIYPPNFTGRPQGYAMNSQHIVPNSEICGVCEKPGGSIRCISACKKYFHKECTEKMAVKTIHQSDNTQSPHQKSNSSTNNNSANYYIHCENCLTRIQKCQHCQQQGQLGLSMNKCGEKQNLPESIKSQLKSPIFICGSHHCHNCAEPFRTDDLIIRCLKCVTAYHENCKEGTRVHFITQKQFICDTHNLTEINTKSINYQNTNGETIGRERLGLPPISQIKQQSLQQIGEESKEAPDLQKSNEQQQKDNVASQDYQKMRQGLGQILESGELLQVQRQGEQANLNTSIFKNTLQGPPQGPPLSTQTAAQWKRLDPSETMSQQMIERDSLEEQPDITKTQQEQEQQVIEKESQAKGEQEEDEQKKLARIIKKYQKIDSIIKRQKVLQDKKYQQFIKYSKGEHDQNQLVQMFE